MSLKMGPSQNELTNEEILAIANKYIADEKNWFKEITKLISSKDPKDKLEGKNKLVAGAQGRYVEYLQDMKKIQATKKLLAQRSEALTEKLAEVNLEQRKLEARKEEVFHQFGAGLAQKLPTMSSKTFTSSTTTSVTKPKPK